MLDVLEVYLSGSDSDFDSVLFWNYDCDYGQYGENGVGLDLC